MRNIDKNCAVALYESKDFKGGNTVVTNEGVWLHGNQIVRIMPEGNLKIQHWFNSLYAVGILQQLERESMRF